MLPFTLASVFRMAESKSVAIVPLEGSNYPMWKVQCWMALVKDGLWSIVNGMETILDKRVAIRVLGLWQGEIELWLAINVARV